MSGISAHMIVKNEDRWVWFAIQSVLPYVDEFLITDTGSTDQTLDILKSINSPKIKLSFIKAETPSVITKIRNDQLKASAYPWVWIVDADEIYPNSLAQECVDATKDNNLEGLLVRRFDLLGDIYHRQSETVGTYNLFGQSGHLLIRLINVGILKNITYKGDYPNEGFFNGSDKSILEHDKNLWHTTTSSLYHAMYLKRSTLGGNLPMFNRSKYKIESGTKITTPYPEVFDMPRPSTVPNPLKRRSLIYEIMASIITPIKNLKRKFL